MALDPGSLHMDINGDQVIDHITTQLRVDEDSTSRTPQSAVHIVASTGMPAHSVSLNSILLFCLLAEQAVFTFCPSINQSINQLFLSNVTCIAISLSCFSPGR
jgi:hypothetical protein